MKEQIIQLDAHDDVMTVRDKLGWIRAPRVLLVFPEDPRVQILQRKLDLVLVQREATRRRAQLALITCDHIVAEHARELGIACFPNIEASRRRFWRTARARLSVQRTEQVTPLDAELVEALPRPQIEADETPSSTRRFFAGIFFGLALAAILAGLYFIAPGAYIHLTPATKQVTVTTTVTADPQATQVDTTIGIIPCRIVGVEVEASVTIDTTGKSDQPTQKARGVVLFTNLIPDQVTIPQGTIVRTSAALPIRFETLVEATLPGTIGATAEVPIEALEAGFSGNLPANRINQIEGTLGTRAAVSNPEPTSGGESAEVSAISQDDYHRLRALVLQQLQQRAFVEMQTDPYIDLQDTEFIPVESLSVVLIHSETYGGYIGEIAEQASLEMRATIQGVAIDDRAARQIMYAQLAEKVGPGYQIGSGTLIFRRGEISQIDDQRRITFIMQGAGDVTAMIQPAQVQDMVAGLPIHEAQSRLDRELPLAGPSEIKIWPKFWPLMPTLPMRIRIEVNSQP